MTRRAQGLAQILHAPVVLGPVLLGPVLLGPVLLGIGGCEQIDDAKDLVDGVTNPLVMTGLHLGVETPDGGVIDLSGTDFAEGAQAKVFLFDASSITDLGDSPVDGALVELVSTSNGGPFSLDDKGSGTYSARGSDGLSYSAEDFSFEAEIDGELSSIAATAPPMADAGIAETHTAGNPMAIDLSGQDFDGVLIAVLDLGNGAITWSNEPATVQDLYSFTHEEVSTQVEIPGDAFEQAGAYAVAVAGTVNASDQDFDNVNTALSSAVSGKFHFYPVTVE